MAKISWCAHPHLACDEPISTWLHRFASANGLSNHTFASQLFGSHAVWPRDIDRTIDDDLLRRAADSLGVSHDRLRNATLRRYEGQLFPLLPVNGWRPWLTPVGVYHRTHRHHGQLFCPKCLLEDRPARLSWRLAFSVACVRHGCSLLDACPTCDAPISLHRIPLEHPGRRPCPGCGRNLAADISVSPLCARAYALQHRFNRALKQTQVCLGTTSIAPFDFFWGARVLIRGLYGNARLRGLTQARTTMQRKAAFAEALSRREPPFEYWRLTTRAHVLSDLERYLSDWPNNFVADCYRAHVYRCRFDSRQSLQVPRWLVTAIETVERRRTR